LARLFEERVEVDADAGEPPAAKSLHPGSFHGIEHVACLPANRRPPVMQPGVVVTQKQRERIGGAPQVRELGRGDMARGRRKPHTAPANIGRTGNVGDPNVAAMPGLFAEVDAPLRDEREPGFELEAVEAGRQLAGTKGRSRFPEHRALIRMR